MGTIIQKNSGIRFRIYPNKTEQEILRNMQRAKTAYQNEVLWNQTISDRYFSEKRNEIIKRKIQELADFGKTEEEIQKAKTQEFWDQVNKEMEEKYPLQKEMRSGFKTIKKELEEQGYDRKDIYELLEEKILEKYPEYENLKDAPKNYMGQCGPNGMWMKGTRGYKLPSALVLATLKNNDNAWKKYFEIVTNKPSAAHLVAVKNQRKQKGKSVENFGKPKFSRYDNNLELCFNTGTPMKNPSYERQEIYLPTIKKGIKARIDKNIQDKSIKVTSITVKTVGKKWFVSYNIKETYEIPEHKHKEKSAGMDLGIKHFVTLQGDDGLSKHFTLDEKTKQRLNVLKSRKKAIQRKLSRTERAETKNGIATNWKTRIKDRKHPDYKPVRKHSKNWDKLNSDLLETNYKISEILKNFRHHVSDTITKKYGYIGIDGLQVSQMTKSAKGNEKEHGKNVKQKSGLNREILEKGWNIFNSQLKYKSGWRGGEVTENDPKYTSQECSACGHVSKDNRKTQASFVCVSCGHQNNADKNAAKNILKKTLKKKLEISAKP